ncbi:V-type proton ATPase subunit S1 [Leptinotarsa decemlineata]|uniref:V-type proton ATPase subunit S1 n=1 Tax=Leptinotarsa decemlineata TaxID=7539 RepID=UPI003D30956E
MFVGQFMFPIFLFISSSNAAVFIWSNRPVQISPLLPFTSEEFSELIEKFENPEVHIFKSPTALPDTIKHITEGFYTAYSPNEDLTPDNITDLSGNEELDLSKIQEILSNHRQSDFISMILIPDKDSRFKREVENITDSTDLDKTTQSKGAVIYRAQNAKTKLYALLYSSQPLMLRKNEAASDLYLGNTNDDMIIYDNRLNVNIPMKRGKITLRFSFIELNGYWYMPSVKIADDTETHRDYNLTTEEEIMASRNFSYHCNGVSIYSDSNGTELHIYDLQVQMDTPNGKFGDAYDCVPFITAPIWSGLLVTSLFGLGLIVALTAIMDIKTMDRFDNYKTKNLNITVSE